MNGHLVPFQINNNLQHFFLFQETAESFRPTTDNWNNLLSLWEAIGITSIDTTTSQHANININININQHAAAFEESSRCTQVLPLPSLFSSAIWGEGGMPKQNHNWMFGESGSSKRVVVTGFPWLKCICGDKQEKALPQLDPALPPHIRRHCANRTWSTLGLRLAFTWPTVGTTNTWPQRDGLR